MQKLSSVAGEKVSGQRLQAIARDFPGTWLRYVDESGEVSYSQASDVLSYRTTRTFIVAE